MIINTYIALTMCLGIVPHLHLSISPERTTVREILQLSGLKGEDIESEQSNNTKTAYESFHDEEPLLVI